MWAHTPPHTHLRKHRVGGQARYLISSPLPVTVRWCGGFRPCVWHKGLLHAWRPTPTGRLYPAGSLPPRYRAESLTLTEVSPQCQSVTVLNPANGERRGHCHFFLSEFCITPTYRFDALLTESSLTSFRYAPFCCTSSKAIWWIPFSICKIIHWKKKISKTEMLYRQG